jgi:hypothetical protein
MIEAKDTVIKNEDIMDLEIPCETCDKKPAWGVPTSECIECMALKHREKQAEISFKAGEKQGMQKVVEWIRKKKCGEDYSITQDCRSSEYTITDKDWQSQLKEWGLLEPPSQPLE